jgi:hypothetical protein
MRASIIYSRALSKRLRKIIPPPARMKPDIVILYDVVETHWDVSPETAAH